MSNGALKILSCHMSTFGIAPCHAIQASDLYLYLYDIILEKCVDTSNYEKQQIDNQGLTNQVSGLPGPPENRSGQPDTGG